MGGAQFSYSLHFLHTVAGRAWCRDPTLYPDGQTLCNPCLNLKQRAIISKLIEILSTLDKQIFNLWLFLFRGGESRVIFHEVQVQYHRLYMYNVPWIKCQQLHMDN